METNTEPRTSLISQLRSLPPNFWFANFMEILERLAFFGVRAVAPLYLVKEAYDGGLGLTQTQKGDIFAIWALVQCLVPMVSGGYAERYGYRKSLVVAFLLNIVGYLGMANSREIAASLTASGWTNANYLVFLTAACLIGLGTAIFKPPVHGTVAKTTDEKTSSLGWGTFYWVVNIGGALAPMCAAQLRGETDWDRVFYAAAIVTACNFVPLFLLYKEPEKDPPAEGEAEKGPFGTFVASLVTIFKDPRLIVFLAIFSCFWLMFMQLWDLLPNFLDEWVDTSDLAGLFGAISSGWVLENGQVKPEMMININPMSIILLVIGVSWVIRKLNKIVAMVLGMLIALVGFVGAGSTQVGIICALMILVFSIGEMACSPTFSAYIGLIAPKDKKALYMGYSNIPFAIGWFLGNAIGGRLYDALANKTRLARKFMVDHLGLSPDLAVNKELLPDPEVMQTMAHLQNGADPAAFEASVRASWQTVQWAGLAGEEKTARVHEIYSQVLGQVDPASVQHATRALWDAYHPYMVWIYLGLMGLVGIVGMIIFYFATRKDLEQEAAAEEAAQAAEPEAAAQQAAEGEHGEQAADDDLPPVI
jgi:dipeptide/tripeptide permease